MCISDRIWHGRGGQGAFTAARLLGAAASLAEGRFVLAFPSFGPERRGAPIRAFTKMDDAPIGDRSASAQADFVVYLDDTLLDEDWQLSLIHISSATRRPNARRSMWERFSARCAPFPKKRSSSWPRRRVRRASPR